MRNSINHVKTTVRENNYFTLSGYGVNRAKYPLYMIRDRRNGQVFCTGQWKHVQETWQKKCEAGSTSKLF